MTDPRFDPAFQRGYSGPDPELVVREQAPAAPVEPAVVEVIAAPDVVATPELVETPAPLTPVRRNPYRLALPLFGLVLLIAAGSTLWWQVLHPQATSTTAESQFVELLVTDLPPILALAGFVCVIVWLALGALDRVDSDGTLGADGADG
ncbi:MAG: hypothetical protein M3N46_13665 [Actinomycetota bacterium]|nr:hypothetical protein [Actinomycetota bacterium]